MLLFPESRYPIENRKKSQTYHQESTIKELLSNSVGEAIKYKPSKPINSKLDYEENQYLANKNKQSYLQSNIFHDTKIQIRNDKQALQYQNNKKKQSSNLSSRVTTEPQYQQPSYVRGTLNQEFRKDDIKVENKQSQQSVLFNTLGKYYVEHKNPGKTNFMASDLTFLKHDSLRDKKLEYKEKQLEAEYQKQKSYLSQYNSTQSQSRRQSKQEQEINVKLNQIEIPKQEITGYDIVIEQKGKGFLPNQFRSIIKHNGFQIKQQENDHYIIQPLGGNNNIQSIAKYLKNYDNKAKIEKVPYQQD
ncbi:unnamed protein product [Paramecium primaurelia]|uniref:Uncharacterized protein n=1 Tax=Paramecium primaurelia TaxID=5886 RepID=A0A8S1NV05_PARPR|nr:unnamed protein product [Paramecium primaurelia]